MSTKRVVIIGAGPGGLASAMLLAGAGYEVTVLERQPRVGGRTSTIGRRRLPLRPGADLLPLPARARVDLRRRGPGPARGSADGPARSPVSPGLRRGGRAARRLPTSRRMERAIAALSPHDAAQLRRFLADNRVKMDEFRGILESPFLRWRDLLSPQLLKVLPLLRPWLSLDGELRRYFQRPAHPAGDDVPVEVPGHVALQLPEPVLDPLVPRVRVWRLSSRRRMRRGLPGDGPGRRGSGRRDLAR